MPCPYATPSVPQRIDGIAANIPNRWERVLTGDSMVRHIHKVLLNIALLLALIAFPLVATRAQSAFAIKITAPTGGAPISGPFALEGATTVPPEKQLIVRVYATATNEQLIAQPVPVTGEVLQQGTFRIVLSYDVSAATPALIQVLYTSPTDGSVVAKAEV